MSTGTTVDAALSYLSRVTPYTRTKARQIWEACHAALGRAPGVVWGYDSNPSNTEHHSGRAIDMMTTHHGWGNDREVGDWIAQHVINNRDRYGLAYVIWRQRIWSTTPGGYGPALRWNPMEDRGSTTENHMDHPHIFFSRDPISGELTTTPGSASGVTEEEEVEVITDQDIERIAKRTAQIIIEGHKIVRPDQHSATLGQHVADIAQTCVALRDGDLPVIERPDGSHRAELGLVLGNIEQRLVAIDDRTKGMDSA